jgi:hypothetical protein
MKLFAYFEHVIFLQAADRPAIRFAAALSGSRGRNATIDKTGLIGKHIESRSSLAGAAIRR